MPGHLQVTLRKREFFFQWCQQTVTDFVCTTCETISVDNETCQHCDAIAEKKRESLQRFLEQKSARERE